MAAKGNENIGDLNEAADPVRRSVNEFCHDVKNKLTVIKEFASIITDGLSGPVTPEQERHLEIITKAVNEAAGMVDRLYQQHAVPKE